jgi:hypothetical protein
MIKQRKQVYWLAALLAALGAVLLYNSRSGTPLMSVISADDKYTPLAVEDPDLRIARLEDIQKVVYPGVHRNIFSAEPPPPPRPAVKPQTQQPVVQQPTGPAELVLPFHYFGYAADSSSGKRRAFFTNGDDVYIASEGEIVLTRFRVLRIGNTTSDLEEIATGRRATLSMEQTVSPPPPQG